MVIWVCIKKMTQCHQEVAQDFMTMTWQRAMIRSRSKCTPRSVSLSANVKRWLIVSGVTKRTAATGHRSFCAYINKYNYFLRHQAVVQLHNTSFKTLYVGVLDVLQTVSAINHVVHIQLADTTCGLPFCTF